MSVSVRDILMMDETVAVKLAAGFFVDESWLQTLQSKNSGPWILFNLCDGSKRVSCLI